MVRPFSARSRGLKLLCFALGGGSCKLGIVGGVCALLQVARGTLMYDYQLLTIDLRPIIGGLARVAIASLRTVLGPLRT